MQQKVKGKFALRCLISAALFGWFFYAVGWRQVGLALVRISPLYVGLAVLLIVAAVVISTVKWRFLLRAQDLEVGGAELHNIYWVGLFFNNLLPSSIGGDAVRVAMVGRQTGKPAIAASSVVMERVVATLALALVGFSASFFVTVRLPYVQAAFAVLCVISLMLMGLLLAGGVPRFCAGSDHRFCVLLRRFMAAGEKVRAKPGLLGACFLWSVIFQLSNVAVNYVLLQGLALQTVGLWDVLVIVPATAVLAMIPVGINGYGLREGGYITLLAAYGVDSASAFSVSILFAFLVSACSLWGGLVWLRRGKGEQVYARENRADCPAEDGCGL